MDAMNACAVVVTFNRKKLLLECLEAIGKQSFRPSGICLLDNASTDGTPQALFERGYLDALPKEPTGNWQRDNLSIGKNGGECFFHYLRLAENSGGAGGFHHALGLALEKGYSHFWLMDDDGVPEEKALEKLFARSMPRSVSCSLVVDPKDPDRLSFGLRIGFRSFYRVCHALRYARDGVLHIQTGNFFNSILVPREIVERIGLPDKELFIWGDELDYLYRILEKGFNVVTVCDSFHRHPVPSVHAAPWKLYYMARNMILLIRRYKNLRYTRVPVKSLIKILSRTLLTGKNCSFVCRGILDGLLGRSGKRFS